MKISQLIKMLTPIKNEYGDNPVYLSSDTEGNGYGTTDSDSIHFDEEKVILYPHNEHLEYNELPLINKEKKEYYEE